MVAGCMRTPKKIFIGCHFFATPPLFPPSLQFDKRMHLPNALGKQEAAGVGGFFFRRHFICRTPPRYGNSRWSAVDRTMATSSSSSSAAAAAAATHTNQSPRPSLDPCIGGMCLRECTCLGLLLPPPPPSVNRRPNGDRPSPLLRVQEKRTRINPGDSKGQISPI